jgi:hypothetical protein
MDTETGRVADGEIKGGFIVCYLKVIMSYLSKVEMSY